MSVILMGIDIPKYQPVTLDIDINGDVWVNFGSTWKKYAQSAIQVPVPHGKIIDADTICFHDQLEAFGNGRYESVKVAYENDIECAHTLLEREE